MNAVTLKGVIVGGCIRSPEARTAVQDALSDIPGLRLALSGDTIERWQLDPAGPDRPHLVLAEVDLDSPPQMDSLERLISQAPDLRVIVVATGAPSLSGMRSALQLGVADLVGEPVRRTELLAAIEALLARRPRTGESPADHPGGGRVVVLMKGGGGAGATTLAVNLAAEHVRRHGSGSTCIIDLDVQFGAVATFLDVDSKVAVTDLLSAGASVDADMLQTAVARTSCGVDVLAAPAQVAPLDFCEPEAVLHLIRTARHSYGMVIIDMPSAWTTWTSPLLSMVDVLCLVSQLTVPSIRGAMRQLETLRDEGLSSLPVVPVINRFTPPLIGKPSMLRQAEKAIGLPLTHFIPSDFATASKAADSGRALQDVGGSGRMRKAISALSDALVKAL